MKKQTVLFMLVTMLGALLNLNSQVINTYAGTGLTSYNGENIQAVTVNLNVPYGICRDNNGNTYVTTVMDHRVRKITGSNIASTIAGSGSMGFSGDGGQATSAQLSQPVAVATDQLGNLYIADNGNFRVRKVSPSGVITTIAGGGSGGDNIAATSASLASVQDVCVDASGDVYIAEGTGRRVRKVSGGIITTIAGTGINGNTGDGGLAINATFINITGISFDENGNLYVCDFGANRIRKIDPAGNISAFAGNGNPSYSGDGGLALNAELYLPTKVACWNGNVYISDKYNHRIRFVNPSGIIQTVIGTGVPGFSGDGGSPMNCMMDSPNSIAIDKYGSIYVSDGNNNRIRKMTCAQPTLNVTSSQPLVLCSGQTATLTVSGATSYTWMPSNQTGTSVVCTSSTTINYTVIGSSNNCMSDTTYQQVVVTCTGIKENKESIVYKAYPNPFKDQLIVESEWIEAVKIVDINGRLVYETVVKSNKATIETAEFSTGIYMLQILGPSPKTIKVIK